MRRPLVLVWLASFFFICASPLGAARNSDELFASGSYRQIIYDNRTKAIDSDRLYWDAKAYDALGQSESACDIAMLFLAWSKGDDERRTEIGRIAIRSARLTGDDALAVDLCDEVELDPQSALDVWQSALRIGQTDLAQDIYKTWLKDLVDGKDYALKMAESGADVASVLDVMGSLEPTDQLDVYDRLMQRSLSHEELSLMLAEAEKLEDSDAPKRRVYHLLADLAEQINQRVLARRWRALGDQEP